MPELVVAPATFRKNGYSYRLLKFVAPFAIYNQAWEGKVIAYEVLIVRTWRGRMGKFAKLNGTARLPSNEEFGRYGWAFPSLPAAEFKLQALVASVASTDKSAFALVGGGCVNVIFSRAGLKTAEE